MFYLSFGSQLVKTVRSLLSLMLSQGMSSSSADKDMAFTLSSRLNTLEERQVGREKKIFSPEAKRSSTPVQPLNAPPPHRPLTCQPQGRGLAASFPFGPGQSAANGSVCFGEQWTLGFFQKLHTYTLGWYTLRSDDEEQKEVWVDKAVKKQGLRLWRSKKLDPKWDGLTSFWLEWKNLREKLHDWEAAENWPRDSA